VFRQAELRLRPQGRRERVEGRERRKLPPFLSPRGQARGRNFGWLRSGPEVPPQERVTRLALDGQASGRPRLRRGEFQNTTGDPPSRPRTRAAERRVCAVLGAAGLRFAHRVRCHPRPRAACGFPGLRVYRACPDPGTNVRIPRTFAAQKGAMR
jgi:hypothetical protein